jgi:hypothetical protein
VRPIPTFTAVNAIERQNKGSTVANRVKGRITSTEKYLRDIKVPEQASYSRGSSALTCFLVDPYTGSMNGMTYISSSV